MTQAPSLPNSQDLPADITEEEEVFVFPTSFGQKRLWFLDQFEPGSPFYNIPMFLRIQGPLEPDVFERALNEVIDRHEALRTTFAVLDDEPVQVISSSLTITIPVVDISHLSQDEREHEAMRLAVLEARQPFDLAVGPLLRGKLIRLGLHEYIILFTMHHIISDGWSMNVLVGEIAALYTMFLKGLPSPLPELPIQYADYALWQAEQIEGDEAERQLGYWMEQLGGELPMLELPTDRPRPAVQSSRGSTTARQLDKTLAEGLKTLALNEGATLFMVLLAAFQTLLYRYTDQDDISIGSPIANRTSPELESLIGLFINTLVFRSDLSGDPSFRELLHRVKETSLQAFDNQDLPFEQLVEVLKPERDMSHTPLFQAMFILQNAPVKAQPVGDLFFSTIDVDAGTATFDITLAMSEMARGLDASVEYSTDLFDDSTIERMLDHFQVLLEGIVSNPDETISRLPMLPQPELEQVVQGWNDTRADVQLARPVHQRFEQMVDAAPDAMAVAWLDQQLTYAELDSRANQLARYLQDQGVGPETIVGVSVRRSLDMIVALMAVLKAGGAYLPIDPDYPRERMAHMLGDSETPIVITQESVRLELPEDQLSGRTVISIDADWREIAAQSNLRPTSGVTSENLAYVIYTSGSTGQSKGVMVSHRNWLNAYYAWENAYGLQAPQKSHLQMANFSFDVFSGDFVRALCSGGKLVLAPRDVLLSAADLYDLMVSEQITIAEFVPPVLRNLVQHLQINGHDLAFMDELICASDSWYAGEYRRFRRFCGPSTRLINSFGLTETTIDTTYFESDRLDLAGEQVVPIGRPFANQQVYILDGWMQPVPIGVPGEIFIGGLGVARGYLARPHLSAERFLPDPFSEQAGVRMYRTGDRARFLPSGDVEFLGRMDFQVKIRGFRIEPGEVESVLGKHPGLKETAVVVATDPDGNKRIAAYVSPAHQPAPTASELRRYLLERLPEYMVPSAFVVLDALPLTPNGKIDRRRLPEPLWDERISDRDVMAPRTPVEEILAGIWQDVLGISHISVFDDFFELGGHSLLATQLMSRIRSAFNLELPLRNIFEFPTIATLAEAVEIAQRADAGVQVPILQPLPHDGPQPVSFAQQRIWFLDQLEPNSPYYNIPEGMRVRGPLDVSVLERSLNEIVRRHASLRTTIGTVEGRPVQIIQPRLKLSIPVSDLSYVSAENLEAEALRLAGEDARTPFVLEQGPLLRMKVLRLEPEDHVILTTMHHIIGDEWSTNNFIQEIAVLYDAFSHNRPSPLPDLPVQYVDFANWQRSWLQGEMLEAELNYWREQLVGAPALLELPTDYPRPPIQTYAGDYKLFSLSPSLSTSIRQMCRQEGVTLFMALLAAFKVLLYRYSGQDDISVGTPIANRNRAELEPLIGFFVNTLVLRTDLGGEPSFREILQRVREVALGSYAHQDIPFEMLVDAVQPNRDLSHSPLFQVMFVIQNTRPGGTRVMSDLTLQPLEAHSGTAKFDLTLFMLDEMDALSGAMEYNTDLFDAATIERMMVHLQNLLAAAVANPDEPITRLPMLTDEERRYLLVDWNQTAFPYPEQLCVHDLVTMQVQRTPDAVAVSDGQETLTYAELERRANQLAHFLQARGSGPESLVGVLAKRSVQVVVALLGVLKAGAAYVPIDPTYPQDRITYILNDAGINTILIQAEFSELLSQKCAASMVSLDADWPQIARHSDVAPMTTVTPENLAYVIYTSGSTGRPKGTMLHHGGVVNYLTWCEQAYPLDKGVGSPVHSSISFDLTVTSMFSPLISGGIAQLVPEELGLDGLVNAMIESDGFSLVKLTPAHLELLSHQIPEKEAAGRSHAFIIGGEALMSGHISYWQEHAPEIQLVNEYGPTETVVGCCVYTASPDIRYERSVPIGRPVINTRLYVLDSYLQPVPVGVPGELFVGGAGVGRGYLRRPGLTSERFIPDPYGEAPGARMYRTGDLVRHTVDGELEFLGRLDYQVKVRGFRIELGEIEANLSQDHAVNDVVALVREDLPGQVRLVAYVTPASDAEIKPSELRDRLSARLPEYMVPAIFVVMDSLPLTPNGKVDRKALPEPEISREQLEDPYVAPRTAVETFLVERYQEVLRVEKVGVNDDFFELGGDSLLAATLNNRLQKHFQESTPLRAIFLTPTVADLARYLQRYHPNVVAKISGKPVVDEKLIKLQRELSFTTTDIDDSVVAQFRRLTPAMSRRSEDDASPPNPPAVFILSPPRSGSTLMRVMLAGHPRLFAPPELNLLNFNTLSERRDTFRGDSKFWLEGTIKAISDARQMSSAMTERMMREFEAQDMPVKTFYGLLQEWIGERLLVDKSPVYSIYADVLERAQVDFENAYFIHLIRNPYATIYSFAEARLDHLFFNYEHPFSRRELAELVWITCHQNILGFLQKIPAERQHRLYFEEMVRQPASAMQDLSAFLDLPFDPAMTEPYSSDRMTSGLRPGRRMVGDYKFYTHHEIDSGVADKWKLRHIGDFLSDVSVDLAIRLGYDQSELTAESALAESAWQPIRPAPEGIEIPLSFAQQRLWFLDQLDPGNAIYNMPTAVGMTGSLNLDALTHAINEIVRRHDTLRTRIVTKMGKASQVIDSFEPFMLPIKDLSHLSPDERERESRRLVEVEAQAPFDLAQGPLFRAKLIKLVEGDASSSRKDDYILLLTLHHIISDGWSLRVLVQELRLQYRAFIDNQSSHLPELPIQYADFAYWQRRWLQGEVLESQLNYWREQLADAPVLLELPTDHPRPPVQTHRGADLFFTLPDSLTAALRSLGRQEGVTLFMSLLAGFQTLMHRYSHQTDICVGTPIANRSRAELENLIGFFVNTLVMRTDFSGSPSFRVLLQRVREVALGAYDHQDLPFEYLVDQLGVERNMSHSSLFQVMFTLDSAASGEGSTAADVSIRSVDSETTTARFDLVLSMIEDGDALVGSLEYNTDLFEQSTIQRMMDHFLILLAGAIDNPDTPVDRLKLLSEAEVEQLYAWNDTQVSIPVGEPVFKRIEHYASVQPDATAVRFVGEQIAELSYAELNRRANQLAHQLLELGVEPDAPVGISVERSLNMVVGLLGIMKAGAAYMPIDPTYPAERIRYMIEDSGISVLLTDQRLEIGAQGEEATQYALRNTQIALLDDLVITTQPTTNPGVTISPDHLAYVIYTSGSTGLPKGVMLQHRGLTNLVDAQTQGFAVDEHSRVLQFASFSFDASVSEVFMALYTGATLVLILPETMQSAEKLLDTLRQEQITTVTLPPSLLSVLAPDDLPELETVISAGEPCTWEVVSRWQPGRRFVNAYGPTEATVGPTYGILDGEKEQTSSVPIGRPTQNVQIHLLGPSLEPVPIGVTGEIFIGGVGVGRGYLKRPALTAEKFIPNPFSDQPGARMYRAGDAGRYLADGRIEFLGRIDDQVKVRGYRIELGEIEAVLEKHPHVQSAAVVIPENGRAKRLVGYIISDDGKELQDEELRAFVRMKLPEYMTPSLFEVIEALPLTPNGKVDRKALAAQELGRVEQMQAFVAPSTQAERLLAQVWQAVLRIEKVGIHDNFFQLGGDSILSIQVISQALAMGLRLEPRHIFQHPTIAELAVVVQSSRIHTEQGLVVGSVPLTPWQHRFFELHRLEPHVRSYALLLELTHVPQPGMLEAAAHQVMRHHDALRLRFEHREAGWVQYNAGDEVTAVFSVSDLSSLSPAEQPDAIRTHAANLRADMNLTSGPLFRIIYFNLGTGRTARLMFVVHDLIFDSFSWPILLQDFLAAVGMLDHNGSVQFPPKTTSFRHWVQRLKEYAQTEAVQNDLTYWLDVLNRPTAALLSDFADVTTVGEADASMLRELTVDETTTLLEDASLVYHTEPLDLLLAALGQVFVQRSDAVTLLVDIEDDQRWETIIEDVDVSRTVGRFTSTYPVALSLANSDHPGEFIKSIKEQLRLIPHAGLSYGLLRYLHEDAEVRRQLQSLPPAPIAFRFVQSPADAITELPAIRIAPESVGGVRDQTNGQPYPVAVEAVVQDGRIQFEWHYDTHHYRPSTIAALANDYTLALRALVEHCLSPEAGGFTQSDVADFGWDETDLQDFEDAFSQLSDF